MTDTSIFFPSDRTTKSLLSVQELVAERVIIKDDFAGLRFIAGVDQAFVDDRIISGIVVLDFKSLEVLERANSILSVDFPYIPTFLSFREGPVIAEVFKKLKVVPDILMVDGAGINHPRRAGIATHIGVALDIPTIGITKKILCGEGREPVEVGEAKPLVYQNKEVGWLLKSSKRSRPIVVAPGHRVSLESSLSITRACLRKHKLPEPTRLAHEYVTGLRKQ